MEKGRILELQGFAGSVARGSIDFKKYSGALELARFAGRMLGWTVGQSSRTREDQYNDGQVVDSKAIPDRFDGDFQ